MLESDGTTPLFPVYRDLGVGLFSNAVRWDWIAPTRPKDPTDPNDPAYTWPSYFSQSAKLAKKNGMEVKVLVLGTPKWANGGKGWPWVPNDPNDYGDFMQAMSKRYPGVDDWMIWGEPNRAPNFKPFTPVKEGNETGPLSKAQQVAPQNYAELLDAAYESIKAVDAGDKVIGGNTYTSAGIDDINPYQWIRDHEAAGRRAPADGHVGPQPVRLRRARPGRPSLAQGGGRLRRPAAARPKTSTRTSRARR